MRKDSSLACLGRGERNEPVCATHHNAGYLPLAVVEADWASSSNIPVISSVDSGTTVGSVQFMGRNKFKRHGTASWDVMATEACPIRDLVRSAGTAMSDCQTQR